MIAFVKGYIEEITEEYVVIDAGSLGYTVRISGRTAQELPGIGQEVKLYTYMSVREDAIWLYGFLSREELSLFKQLITVSGIGPKGGLALLSVMGANDLRFAIVTGDTKQISKAPGIGARTAGRLILDLKDKLSADDLLENQFAQKAAQSGFSDTLSARNEAVEALIALGYSASDAHHAVSKVTITDDMDAELILKLALKNMF